MPNLVFLIDGEECFLCRNVRIEIIGAAHTPALCIIVGATVRSRGAAALAPVNLLRIESSYGHLMRRGFNRRIEGRPFTFSHAAGNFFKTTITMVKSCTKLIQYS